MTAPTTRSAFPVPVEELVPKARELAEQLGAVPSRNRLMTEFRIGANKAKTILARLCEDVTTGQRGPTGLHLVIGEPETGPGSAPPEDTAGQPTSGDDSPLASTSADPGSTPGRLSGVDGARRVAVWPVFLLALPALVAIWSGWVGLGGLTGFGIVHPLPGIADGVSLNTAITLPIGVETYAAYALRVWLSGRVPLRARRFAKVSALGSLALGALGQVTYHLMTAAGVTAAPWPITTLVACLPVAVLGMGAALTHLLRSDDRPEVSR
jgi:hypothetical protein